MKYLYLLTLLLVYSFFVKGEEKKVVKYGLRSEIHVDDKSDNFNILNNTIAFIRNVINALQSYTKVSLNIKRREYKPSFTDLVRNCIDRVLEFDDNELEKIPEIIKHELKKYFDDILDETSELVETIPGTIIRDKLEELGNKLDKNDFNKHQRVIMEFLETVYNQVVSKKLLEAMQNLNNYQRNTQTNTLIKSLFRKVINNIYVHYYMNLNVDAKEVIKNLIKKLFRVLTDKDKYISRPSRTTTCKKRKHQYAKTTTKKLHTLWEEEFDEVTSDSQQKRIHKHSKKNKKNKKQFNYDNIDVPRRFTIQDGKTKKMHFKSNIFYRNDTKMSNKDTQSIESINKMYTSYAQASKEISSAKIIHKNMDKKKIRKIINIDDTNEKKSKKELTNSNSDYFMDNNQSSKEYQISKNTNNIEDKAIENDTSMLNNNVSEDNPDFNTSNEFNANGKRKMNDKTINNIHTNKVFKMTTENFSLDKTKPSNETIKNMAKKSTENIDEDKKNKGYVNQKQQNNTNETIEIEHKQSLTTIITLTKLKLPTRSSSIFSTLKSTISLN